MLEYEVILFYVSAEQGRNQESHIVISALLRNVRLNWIGSNWTELNWIGLH